MSNNIHNNSSCAYAEQMISYLYGEAEALEKTKFETHLKICPTCADELAAFGFVRSAVLDWRAEGFSKLPTPAFDIPDSAYQESFSTPVVSDKSRPWFAGFRQMFSFDSMKAVTAFGITVFCVGLIWLTFSFSSGNDITENRGNVNSVEAAVSPNVEINNPEEKNIAGKNDEKFLLSNEIANPAPPVKREKPDRSNKSTIKVSGNAPKNNSNAFARNLKETGESIKKSAPVQRKLIPNLSGAEDEEEETIRLADLFDEIGAR